MKVNLIVGSEPVQHLREIHSGILLVQTGTPAQPTSSALRAFLGQFLADRRVIQLPRWLWMPILHAIILRTRPAKAAARYREIWTDAGSPLLTRSLTLAQALEKILALRTPGVGVEIGMRYGNPSIASAMRSLRERGAQRLLLLPLFPQFSNVTVGSVYDAVFDELRSWAWLPELSMISGYHRHPAYLKALARSIENSQQGRRRPDRLLFSYHGIPQSYSQSGDPYVSHCHETSQGVASLLEIGDLPYESCFQSHFGPQAWSQPYTDEVLRRCAESGEEQVDIICPGFALDCLETLHEIDFEARSLFHQAGGQALHYIPALNDSDQQLAVLTAIIEPWLLDPAANRKEPTQ